MLAWTSFRTSSQVAGDLRYNNDADNYVELYELWYGIAYSTPPTPNPPDAYESTPLNTILCLLHCLFAQVIQSCFIGTKELIVWSSWWQSSNLVGYGYI